MPPMLDLRPATDQLTVLLQGVTDQQLSAPTPCERYSLGDLVEHIAGLSLAFALAAAKTAGPATSQAPSGDAARLGDDWRTRIPEQLTSLAEAWREPSAWTGATRVGGVDLPGEVAGRVALNELVLHGWDVARASGQPFDCAPQLAGEVLGFLSALTEPGQEASRNGIFGPVVEVPADAPELDRIVGLSGRDPYWKAG
ncbi:TIGR03086 family metal-binding protein [Streptacidiphilus griseoplanus]|uniref:TIGR03086 family metal-binding protein n=1 Tax=Peterkaempfera griseoplana TaxID=66896 RepID=UPI0006E2AF3E|nr:TIGR03086 family metal-binding protein [Peterkaempfera griseoplana]